MRAERMVDEILEIADGPALGYNYHAAQGKSIAEIAARLSESIQHARLKIDARKWLVGKMNPKRFGDTARIRFGPGDKDERADEGAGFVLHPAKRSSVCSGVG